MDGHGPGGLTGAAPRPGTGRPAGPQPPTASPRPGATDRLGAVRRFTFRAIAASGAVGDDGWAAFPAHGYTRRNALEVALGIGAYRCRRSPTA
ncbi:hypothetical protein C0216_09400 [Streptomyces globosus]|uniref:Uncharacterized protein n=1 Tax=Streptomyces globosus TaxID=68209 RepID=A0A344TYC5_9ACTN|nr:hypothetical protein C0216_09400 [Streptomyces globosus]